MFKLLQKLSGILPNLIRCEREFHILWKLHYMSGKGGLFDEERHWVFVHIAKGFQGYAQNDIYGLNVGLVEFFFFQS